jgi:hypothetical protein
VSNEEFDKRFWLGKPLAVVEGKQLEVVGIDREKQLIMPGRCEVGVHPVYGRCVVAIHRGRWRKPLPSE